MTEKHYGGASKHEVKAGSSSKNPVENNKIINKDRNSVSGDNDDKDLSSKDIEDIKKAGKIAQEVVKYAKSIIKPKMLLLDIANKIEDKIIELKAKPAFPVNLSINEIAAHYTPSWNDTETAHGLLKVDIGVQINGWTADTAFSLDLEDKEENKKLIRASELALEKAIKIINNGTTLSQIGSEIESSIKSLNVQPIQNLSGHSIEKNDLHAGLTIPNYENSSNIKIVPGLYAIEPFSTSGLGKVRDGKPSGIYKLERTGSVRDNFAREVLSFIVEEYQTLPFCSRWIYKKFSSRGLLALRQIEQSGILHHYPQLIEVSGKNVAQSEHTILITEKEKTVTTN